MCKNVIKTVVKIGSTVAESMHTNLLINIKYHNYYSSFLDLSKLNQKNWLILELSPGPLSVKFKIQFSRLLEIILFLIKLFGFFTLGQLHR